MYYCYKNVIKHYSLIVFLLLPGNICASLHNFVSPGIWVFSEGLADLINALPGRGLSPEASSGNVSFPNLLEFLADLISV